MKIKVKYFAIYRDLLKRDEELVEVDAGSSVASLFDCVMRDYISKDNFFSATLFAVNREYVERDHPLAEGDEVAFIPPVAGG